MAPAGRRRGLGALRRGLLAALGLALAGLSAFAEPLTLAFWNSDLERRTPGALLVDAHKGADQDIRDARALIAALDADVLVLGGIDYDAGGLALAALNAGLERPYPYLKPLRPNTGVPSGFDLDGNGWLTDARDALAYGHFPGQGGMAVLSRLPIDEEASRDFSPLLWAELPGARLPPLPKGALKILPLSSTGHHDTAILLPDGRILHLLSWHGSTPAFDGPEDRNGKRNHDETRFWSLLLDGALPFAPPSAPFALIGQANADPQKGDGDPDAIRRLLADARLQDVIEGDTVDYKGAVGPLRVSYILPSAGMRVLEAGKTPPIGTSARHWALWLRAEP